MSKRHPLDDAFQNKLRDYSMPVPPEMWQNIEGEMSRKRYPVWLPWIMGTTAIVTLALVGYLLLSGDANNHAKGDNTSEPTADASKLQVTDIEEDTYSLSNELSTDNSTEEQVANTLPVGELLNSSGESHRSNSNELTQQTESDAPGGSSSVRTSAGKSNSNREDKTKAFSGLANADRTEPDASVSTSALRDVKEQTQGEMVKKGHSSDADEREGKAKVADTWKSEPSGIKANRAMSLTNPASLNFDAPDYYVLSDEESMGIPKLRKIRDRNCEDEHFSPGNIFLEFSYSLHHGNLSFRSTGDIFDSYANLRSNGEQFSLSRQFQGLIAFQVGRRAYFKTGISINVLESDYYFVDQVNKRSIRDSIWNERTMEYDVTVKKADIYIDGTNKYTFIDIPLLFSYGWQFNKIGMNLTTGPLVNISFTREGNLPSLIGQGIDLDDGLWNDRDIYRKTAGLSWFLSTQISYQAYRNVDIYIEPRIISGLNSITLENDGTEVEISKTSYPLSQRIFQYGVGAGLRFSLNNK